MSIKKKLLLPLLAVIAVIGVAVCALVVVLPTSRVTLANFHRIEVGMTHADVVKIFGEEPVISAFVPSKDGPGKNDLVKYWSAPDGSRAMVIFHHDRVFDSIWTGSTETLWAKLRRWVGLK